MKSLEKRLPPCDWIYTHKLPAFVTDEQLSEFFHNQGLFIPTENISLKTHDGKIASCVVAVPNETLAKLVNWYLKGQPLGGQPLDYWVAWRRTGYNQRDAAHAAEGNHQK
jgi:hypothetical protein